MQADLRMKCCGTRKTIVDTIKMIFATLTRSNLPIFGVRQKNLGMYTTQESDVVKGISRIPLPFARLNEEDVVDIDLLTLRHSQLFELPEEDGSPVLDELNDAFSSLILQKGEISSSIVLKKGETSP